MQKKYLVWGLIWGVLAVIIGALGAHALKPHLTIVQQASFETGIKYQMYHAFILLIVSQIDFLRSKLILNLIVLGIFCFSISIYIMNLKELMGLSDSSFLGPITPIGGLLLISAWIIMIYKSIRYKAV